MVVLFHAIFLIAKYLVKVVTKSIFRGAQDDEIVFKISDRLPEAEFSTVAGIKFYPPVYEQRYAAVRTILAEGEWKRKVRKVVDFGCAQLGFFPYLKRLPGVNEIVAVDIDEELLKRYSCTAAPLNSDFLNMRTEPLIVTVYAGSVADTDHRLLNSDAVVCIELIEHLYPNELDAVPYTVFGFIQPLIAIFTTPNVDFNVLFPNPHCLRHDDHKFEWTRQQFREWANNIASRYPVYTVKFYGIGPGPKGTEAYGCCTQMAVFVKNTSSCLDSTPELGQSSTMETQEEIKKSEDVFKLVQDYEYPVYVDERSDKEKTITEARYQLNILSNQEEFETADGIIIPLQQILPHVKEWCSSLSELRDILEEEGFQMKERGPEEIYVLYYYSSSEDTSSRSTEMEFWELATEEKREENWDECDVPWSVLANERGSVLGNVKDFNTEHSSVNSVKDLFSFTCSKTDSVKSFNKPSDHNYESSLPKSGSELSDCRYGKGSFHNKSTSWRETNMQTCSHHSNLFYFKGFLSKTSSVENVNALKDCRTMCKSLSNLESTNISAPKYYPKSKSAEIIYSYESLNLREKADTVEHQGMPIETKVYDNNNEIPLAEKRSMLTFNNAAVANRFLPNSGASQDTHSLNTSAIDDSLQLLYLNLHAEQLNSPRSPPKKMMKTFNSDSIPSSLQGSLHDKSLGESYSFDEQNDKAIDSGYPNSSSVLEMDMDRTPEQVDEISSENDELLSESSRIDDIVSDDYDSESVSSGTSGSIEYVDNEDRQLRFFRQPNEAVFDDAVENGDVANNNRDGEGNNAIADIDPIHDPLAFQIDAAEHNIIPLLAAAEDFDNDNDVILPVDMHPFPIWLLRLLDLAPVANYMHVGEGDIAATESSEDEGGTPETSSSEVNDMEDNGDQSDIAGAGEPCPL